jgi:RNA polymerase sigma-70 factor (ECF subfamily)
MTIDTSANAARFTDLLHRTRGHIFGYIYSLVHNQADAEDLFQETAIHLWSKFDEYDPDKDFGRWATQFAHFTVLNFVRVNRRRQRFFSEELLERITRIHQQEETEQSAARAEALDTCFERLPETDRQLVESCYAGNHTMKQVALEKRRTVAAVYQAMSRIRRILLSCVQRTLAREHH